MNKFIYLIGIIIVIIIIAIYIQNKPTGKEVLRICPDEWIDDMQPSVPLESEDRQYFILDGERRELNEFDVDWVMENCGLEIQEVF